jgi:hypothetical protein
MASNCVRGVFPLIQRSSSGTLLAGNTVCCSPTMALRYSLGLLRSCLLLLFSVAYRTLIWCWLAPPAAFSFFGISGNKKKTTARKLSSPIHDLKPSYDVVVIGSGYGGGVAASRLARAQLKQSVCVLEAAKSAGLKNSDTGMEGFQALLCRSCRSFESQAIFVRDSSSLGRLLLARRMDCTNGYVEETQMLSWRTVSMRPRTVILRLVTIDVHM